jgi:hypothetical protein
VSHPGFRIIVRHNGEVCKDFSSADHIWDTATWIHELSNHAIVYPGDILWMGTEGADGDMFPGDTIEVEISGIGTLWNYVVAEKVSMGESIRCLTRTLRIQRIVARKFRVGVFGELMGNDTGGSRPARRVDTVTSCASLRMIECFTGAI